MNISARVLLSTALVSLGVAAPASADVSFTTATNVPTNGTFPSELVAADFNNDGVTDLATPECGDLCGSPGPTGSVTMLLGNGTGGFTNSPGTPFGPPTGLSNPDVMSAGDFDDDGRVDLAVYFTNGGNHHAIYRGRDNTTQSFFDGVDQGSDAGSTEGAAVGDINGDGDADLVLGRSSFGVGVRLGDGTGAVGAPTTVTGTGGGPLNFSTQAIALGDLDRDGDLDVVAGLLGGGVLVLRNNGTGTLTLLDRFSGGDTLRELDLGDLNRDGDLDIVASAEGKGPTVMLGDSGVSFGPPTTYPSAGGDVESAVIADFDRDGRLDVAVREDVAATAVSVFKGDGGGGLTRVATLASTTGEDGQAGIAAPDVNNDGAPDIVITNTGTRGLSLYRSLAIGSVGAADFDDTATGSRSLERTIEVENRGTAPLAITSANITGANAGDFTKTSDGCTGVTVARGGSCQVNVRFVPATTATAARRSPSIPLTRHCLT